MAVWAVTVFAAASTGLAFRAPHWAIAAPAVLVTTLVAFPRLREHWSRRPEARDRTARRWLSGRPDPVEIAFLRGGPGRVADLLLFDLLESGRVVRAGDGAVRSTAERDAGVPRPSGRPLRLGRTPPVTKINTWLYATALRELARARAQGTAPGRDDRLAVRGLRWAICRQPELRALWHRLVRAGLVRSRPQLRWIYKGLPVSVAVLSVPILVAAVVAGARVGWPGPALAWWTGLLAAVSALGWFVGVALRWLPGRLTGFRGDLRTAAGLRASELLAAGPEPVDRRRRVAVVGLSELDADSGWSAEPSFWHVVPFRRRWRYRRAVDDRWRWANETDGSLWFDAVDLGTAWTNRRSDGGGAGEGDGGAGDSGHDGGAGGDGGSGGDGG